PDWGARSQAYRDCIYQVYRDAGLPSDSVGSMQANLRYHIGNALRQMAPAEDLEALGMDPAGPQERAKRYRKKAKERPVQQRADRQARQASLLDMNDPMALVGLARTALQAARDLNPQGPEAEGLQLVLRELISEAF